MFTRRSSNPLLPSHNLITVSGAALRQNAELIGRLADADVFPVLKGNAYGHGVELVARALKDFRTPYVAVNTYDEARRIQAVTPRPVLVMGAMLPAALAACELHDMAFVVHDAASIEALGRRGRPVKLHLEVNTGMNRYGVEPDNLAAMVKLIARHPTLELEGLMSHLADADGANPATVSVAVSRFDAAVEQVRALGLKPLHLHVAQTAGSAVARSKYATGVRAGIGLYGINPFSPDHPAYARLANLQPALKFTSIITDTHNLQAGDQVSYNYTFTAKHAMRIGVVPAGYYEGVNRELSNAGQVVVDGRAAPVIGRVCMNHTMISLEGTDAQEGSRVTIISDDPANPNTIANLAMRHGLFSYSSLTSLAADVPRQLV